MRWAWSGCKSFAKGCIYVKFQIELQNRTYWFRRTLSIDSFAHSSSGSAVLRRSFVIGVPRGQWAFHRYFLGAVWRPIDHPQHGKWQDLCPDYQPTQVWNTSDFWARISCSWTECEITLRERTGRKNIQTHSRHGRPEERCGEDGGVASGSHCLDSVLK